VTSVRNALIAFVLIFAAHGATAMPLPAAARLGASVESRSPGWLPVRLCNGISKHTRTICCGTNPPAWCGMQPEAQEVGAGKYDGGLTSILGDPMFYACLFTCVTVIYLVALAGSGRDRRAEDAV